MADSLAKLQRMRDRERKAARLELARAERAKASQAARLEENRHQARNARTLAQSIDPVELARYHAFQLRMEMARRRETTRLEKREQDVERKQAKLVEAMREARVVELVAEVRAEQEALEARRQESGVLDEVGLQSWFRRSA